MPRVELVTPANSRLITLDQAKQHCRCQHDAENDLFTGWIKAAEDFVQDYTNRALMTSTWQWIGDCFPSDEDGADDAIDLIIGPVQSVASMTYTDVDGVEQTLDAEDYQFQAHPISPKLWPGVDSSWPWTQGEKIDAVRINLIAGYASAERVPARFSQAMLLLIGEWFEKREETSIPDAVYHLLDRLKAERYV